MRPILSTSSATIAIESTWSAHHGNLPRTYKPTYTKAREKNFSKTSFQVGMNRPMKSTYMYVNKAGMKTRKEDYSTIGTMAEKTDSKTTLHLLYISCRMFFPKVSVILGKDEV